MFYRLFFILLFLFPFRNVYAESLVLKETECEKTLVSLIEGANEYIDVSVYAINNKNLVNALISAHQRGIRVRILTDRLQAAGTSSRIWELIGAGVPLRVHTHKKIMHTKVAVYDGISVSSGSLNWTEPAVHKNEEVCDIFINEPEYAKQHQALFDERWELNSEEKSAEWLNQKQLEREQEQKKKDEQKQKRKKQKTTTGKSGKNVNPPT